MTRYKYQILRFKPYNWNSGIDQIIRDHTVAGRHGPEGGRLPQGLGEWRLHLLVITTNTLQKSKFTSIYSFHRTLYLWHLISEQLDETRCPISIVQICDYFITLHVIQWYNTLDYIHKYLSFPEHLKSYQDASRTRT